MIKACMRCGADISGMRGNARFCSVKCGRAHRFATSYKQPPPRTVTCPCGDEFEIPAGCRGVLKFCGRECRAKYGAARNHGLSQEQAKAYKQGKSCAVCGESDPAKLVVDHDHITLRVRGVLCGHCNRALGTLGEDPVRCLSLAAYIRSECMNE